MYAFIPTAVIFVMHFLQGNITHGKSVAILRKVGEDTLEISPLRLPRVPQLAFKGEMGGGNITTEVICSILWLEDPSESNVSL